MGERGAVRGSKAGTRARPRRSNRPPRIVFFVAATALPTRTQRDTSRWVLQAGVAAERMAATATAAHQEAQAGGGGGGGGDGGGAKTVKNIHLTLTQYILGM